MFEVDPEKVAQAWHALPVTLNQQELADKAGIDVKSLSRILNGHTRFPQPATLRALADALNVTPQSLYRCATNPAQGHYGLMDCFEHFLEWEAAQPPQTPLSVSSIGLDLTSGFDNFQAAINHTRSEEIDLTLLVLTGDADALPGAPPEVLTWCATAQKFVDLMARMLRQLRTKKRISLTIKDYCELPVDHGVRVEKGAAGYYYVTRCCPSGTDLPVFDWGRDAYWIIQGDSTQPEEQTRRQSFADRYARLLADSRGRCLLSYP